MKDLLRSLNEIPCVQGSMVITDDGIMVVACLGKGLEEDVVAALSSSLVITLSRSLKPMETEPLPDELVLTGSEGKLVFLDLGRAFLVVVTRQNLKLDTDLVEIRSIARKLRHRCEITT